MSTSHPLRIATDTVDTNNTEGGITETLYDALQKRMPLALSATETLGDYDFSAGSVPLSVVYGQTGYVYFYNADDTTSADDGLTVLVSADGRRYILADASAIAIASVLSMTNTPPGSPSAGDAYIVDTAPTGAWVGHAKDIALYTPRGWVFAAPKVGEALLNEATGLNVQYSAAGSWAAMATALDVQVVTPELMLMPMGLSVEARQNAPPGSPVAGDGKYYLVGTSGSGAWSGHSNEIAYYNVSSAWAFFTYYNGARIFNKTTDGELVWFTATGLWQPITPINWITQGRLTLESGVAISTTDQTAKATLYFTPFKGNTIGLYTGSDWVPRTFTQKSLSLSGYTSGKPFDIFIYDSSGSPTLESLVWTNDTTRATALTTQDGVLVKSGDATRKYLGTIYTSATGQCEDSLAKRYVWNYYNRVHRVMSRYDTTNSWAYSTQTWRQARGSSSNQLDYVVGVAEDHIVAEVLSIASNNNTSGSTGGATGIGIDSTSNPTNGTMGANRIDNGAPYTTLIGTYRGAPGIGHHYIAWLEYGATSGTTTWYGDDGGSVIQSGLTAAVYA
jgi:hypothetical protein